MHVLNSLLALGCLTALAGAQEPSSHWVDPETGHRVVRLSDQAGSSTLYFHDNSYSPEGDKLMFNTPAGVATVDVAKIGAPDLKVEVVIPGVRGGHFARQTREIYSGGSRGGRGLIAVNVDTKQMRQVSNARGIVNNPFKQQPAKTTP